MDSICFLNKLYFLEKKSIFVAYVCDFYVLAGNNSFIINANFDEVRTIEYKRRESKKTIFHNTNFTNDKPQSDYYIIL